MRFLLILAAVAFGVMILGISVIQVRGIQPGQTSINGELINPNSELSLYVADPSFLLTVIRQRVTELTAFKPQAKAEYRLYLSQERFTLAEELLAEGRMNLGLWTWRKALIYQAGVIDLYPEIESGDEREKLADRLVTQISQYQKELQLLAQEFTGTELETVEMLRKLLTDNTQRLQVLVNQESH